MLADMGLAVASDWMFGPRIGERRGATRAPGLDPPAGLYEAVRERQKKDANDAAAIYEALSRPDLRFAKVRSIANQEIPSDIGGAHLVQVVRAVAFGAP